jgi:hypothetical protein
MCDPLTIGLMLAGTAASVVGTGMQAKETIKNDARVAEARNQVLRDTMRKNKEHADANRAAFNTRIDQSEAQPAAQNLANAQTAQTEALTSNLGSTAVDTSLSGDAPQVVKSNLAKTLADAFAESKAKAQSMGKLGGYGANARDDAIADSALGSTINTNNDFVRGDLGIMPYLQDYAEIRARKPSSGLGSIISAFGKAAGSYAGSR